MAVAAVVVSEISVADVSGSGEAVGYGYAGWYAVADD